MKVATLEYIAEVGPHPNADKLDLAKIKGWQVCVKRGEFKKGDLCVYICIDTILEECPQYEFLRSKNFKIKPIKLRGQLSEGIVFPTSILKEFSSNIVVLDEGVAGTDVSTLVKAKHYEKPMPSNLSGQVKGYLPSFLRKTDEENIENVIDVLIELKGKPYYTAVKVDGSSGTFYIKNGEFGVCSRNLELKEDENNGFWKIAKKYDIENKLKHHFNGRNMCVQGEVYGPGIQHNLLGVTEISFALFNLWDIDNRCYLNYVDVVNFCKISDIPMVHVIEEGISFDKTIKELQTIANNLKYPNGHVAEGIVVRPQIGFISRIMKQPCSFKVKNEEFKLKHE